MALNLKLHRKQIEVFKSKARVKVLVAGRRFGKSRLLLTTGVTMCLSFKGKIDPASPPVVAIVMPTLKAGRAIHWQPLLNLLEKSPLVSKVDKSDFRIQFKGKKPDLLLRGANDSNGDNLRGLKLYGVLLDEYQDFNPNVWEKVLYPAMTDTPGSKALVIGTPKGITNILHEMKETAIAEPDWEFFSYETADNPFVPRKEIERAKKVLPPKIYDQEFRACFVSFAGQIYDQFDKNLHTVEETPSNFRSIFLGADWGDINPALAVVGVTKEGIYYVLDDWYNESDQPIVADEVIDRAKYLCLKYDIYRAALPDDRPASIIAFRKAGEKHSVPGLKRSVQINRNKPGIMEGNRTINSLFYQGRLKVNSKLTGLISELQSYRREVDENDQILDRPAKGQKNHRLDAMRYVIAPLEYKNLNFQ